MQNEPMVLSCRQERGMWQSHIEKTMALDKDVPPRRATKWDEWPHVQIAEREERAERARGIGKRTGDDG